MRELEEAVKDLTQPVMEHFAQKDDDGRLIKLHSAQHPPLLTQLEEAMGATSAQAGGGGASLPSMRSIIDADALFEFHKMASQIGDWCRMVRVRPTRHPVPDLQAWFQAYSNTDSDPDWYRRKLREWKHTIGEILDRPKRFEVAFCPVCKNTTWLNPDGDRLTYPILVEYRLSPLGKVSKEKARCRVTECGAIWDTLASIEELAEELTAEPVANLEVTC